MAEPKLPLNGRMIGAWTGAGGVIVAGATLLMSQIDSAKHDAEAAIEVAVQHGEELNTIRSQLNGFIQQVADIRAQMNLGGRFTRADGDRLDARLRRLEERLDRLERVNLPALK